METWAKTSPDGRLLSVRPLWATVYSDRFRTSFLITFVKCDYFKHLQAFDSMTRLQKIRLKMDLWTPRWVAVLLFLCSEACCGAESSGPSGEGSSHQFNMWDVFSNKTWRQYLSHVIWRSSLTKASSLDSNFSSMSNLHKLLQVAPDSIF